eukprot:GHVR01063957.1.p1 GENE.GHVR01063957.1~~GHVR01063957.1.p1  ORF type:complete len:448 (+),score=74.84 GHVR01063957.1:84-1427(+)
MAEGNVSHAVSTASRNYLVPKGIAESLVAIGQHKISSPIWKTVVGSFYGGFYAVFGGMLATVMAGGISQDVVKDYPMFPNLFVGLSFWTSLLFVLSYGGDIVTSNFLYCGIALAQRRVGILMVLLNWLIVFICNFLSVAFMGYILGYLTHYFKADPENAFLKKYAEDLINENWGVCLVKAIGANWLVCLSITLTVASQDMASRVFSCFLPFFAFAAAGYQLCVMNMYFGLVAIYYGANINFGFFLYNNIIPSLLGNLIGALMNGGGLWVIHLADFDNIFKIKQKISTGEAQKLKEIDASFENSDFPRVQYTIRFVRATGEVLQMHVDTSIVLSSVTKVPTHAILRCSRSETRNSNQEWCHLMVEWDGVNLVENNKLCFADLAMSKALGYSNKSLCQHTISQLTYGEDTLISTPMYKEAMSTYHANNAPNNLQGSKICQRNPQNNACD